MHAQLQNWFIFLPLHPNSAKLGDCRLHGEVFNHPNQKDGTEVITSDVVVTDGHMVSTRSLTAYDLGEPDPAFVQKLQNLGILYNPGNPLGFINETANGS